MGRCLLSAPGICHFPFCLLTDATLDPVDASCAHCIGVASVAYIRCLLSYEAAHLTHDWSLVSVITLVR